MRTMRCDRLCEYEDVLHGVFLGSSTVDAIRYALLFEVVIDLLHVKLRGLKLHVIWRDVLLRSRGACSRGGGAAAGCRPVFAIGLPTPQAKAFRRHGFSPGASEQRRHLLIGADRHVECKGRC